MRLRELQEGNPAILTERVYGPAEDAELDPDSQQPMSPNAQESRPSVDGTHG